MTGPRRDCGELGVLLKKKMQTQTQTQRAAAPRSTAVQKKVRQVSFALGPRMREWVRGCVGVWVLAAWVWVLVLGGGEESERRAEKADDD